MNTAILTFEAADARWGIPVTEVGEIVAVREVVHVPLAPESVAGMIPVQGSMVGAIDFARLAGGQPRTATSAIVLKGREAALLVDTLCQIVVADELLPATNTLPWVDGRAGSAHVISPLRLLEAVA